MFWSVCPSPLKRACIYVIFDALMSSAAAAAVVALGTHMEGISVEAAAYGTAVVTAVAKALLLGASVIPLLNLRASYMYAFAHIAAKFLFSTVATAVISHIVLGYVPGKLVAAAAIATIPWLGEDHTVYTYAVVHRGPGIMEYSFEYPMCPNFDMLAAVAFDTLAGFVFGKAVQGFGFDFFSPRTSTAAGAVFGALVGIPLNLYNITIGFIKAQYVNDGEWFERTHEYGGYLEERARDARQAALEAHDNDSSRTLH